VVFDKCFVQHYSQEELGRERYGASGQSLENGRKCRMRATAERYSTSYGGSRVIYARCKNGLRRRVLV